MVLGFGGGGAVSVEWATNSSFYSCKFENNNGELRVSFHSTTSFLFSPSEQLMGYSSFTNCSFLGNRASVGGAAFLSRDTTFCFVNS